VKLGDLVKDRKTGVVGMIVNFRYERQGVMQIQPDAKVLCAHLYEGGWIKINKLEVISEVGS